MLLERQNTFLAGEQWKKRGGENENAEINSTGKM